MKKMEWNENNFRANSCATTVQICALEANAFLSGRKHQHLEMTKNEKLRNCEKK